MYTQLIPIMNRKLNSDESIRLVKELKDNKIDNILLVFSRVLCNDEMLKNERDLFCENKTFFEQNGITVGAWFAPTIGYGSAHPGDNNAGELLTPLITTRGRVVPGAFCPLDENFVAELIKNLTAIAETGVERILFEDDFTLSGGKMLHETSCLCELHMQKYREILGEDIKAEKVGDLIFGGEANKYRNAFIKLMGDTLRDLCRTIEKAVHSINKNVRIGLAANASSYDIEGVSVAELAEIIAGDKKPFIRTTGAPYWRHSGMLANNIESTRVQRSWCNDNIELIAEGDTYPRPRHWVPSSYLECFDMITRADGSSDGILKYMIDYNSSPDYETGYTKRHSLNEAHYNEIKRRFSGKKTVGLNLFENPLTFKNRSFNEEMNIWRYGKNGYLPFASQWLASDNSIPTAYGLENTVSVAFGENAKYLTDSMLQKGVIIDALAAKFLMEKGIDIGVTDIKRVNKPSLENFPVYNERTITNIHNDAIFYNMTLKSDAQILSEFGVVGASLGVVSSFEKCKEKYPACFYYKNSKGQKFIVYSFIAETAITLSEWSPGIFRNYCRQKQLADAYKLLEGKPLPAMCYGNPQLYILCRKDESSMAVGLWNLFADEVLNPEIELDKEYKRIDFYNCTGSLKGNKVILDKNIDPYKFAFFTVYDN